MSAADTLKSVRNALWNKSRYPESPSEKERYDLAHQINDALNEMGRDLTFQTLIVANLSRVEKWHGLQDWSTLEWAGAMCGEAGEAANFAKKLKRVEMEIQNNDKRTFGVNKSKEELIEIYRKGVGMESADAIIYSVLLCARANVDLVACIKEAFNAKSQEYGFPERI